MTSGGNNFNDFDENQLTIFSAGDAGDFSDAAGEQKMAPKCGSLPRDAGDLVGLEDPKDSSFSGYQVHPENRKRSL